MLERIVGIVSISRYLAFDKCDRLKLIQYCSLSGQHQECLCTPSLLQSHKLSGALQATKGENFISPSLELLFLLLFWVFF